MPRLGWENKKGRNEEGEVSECSSVPKRRGKRGGREGGRGKLRLGSGKRTGKKLSRMREIRSRGIERRPLGCCSQRGEDDGALEGEGEGQGEGEEEQEGDDGAVGRGMMPATMASAPMAVCAAAGAGGHHLGKLPLLTRLLGFWRGLYLCVRVG